MGNSRSENTQSNAPASDASRAVHSRILDAISDPSALLTRDGRVLHCNESFAGVCRRPRSSVVGTDLGELFREKLTPRDYVEALANDAPIAVHVGSELEQRELVLLPSSERDEKDDPIIAILQDTVHSARYSERLRFTARAIGEGLWDWSDISDSSVWWSDRMLEIIGVESDSNMFSLEHFFDLVHPDDREKVAESTERLLGSDDVFQTEYRLRHAAGHYVWLQARGRTFHDNEGNPIRMVGTIRDVSDQRQTKSKLADNLELMRQAEGIASFGSWAWDEDPDRRYWSEQMYVIHGLPVSANPPSREEWLATIRSEDVEGMLDAIRNAKTDELNEHQYWTRDLDGRGPRHVWIRWMIRLDDQGKPSRQVGVSVDLTEATRLESALRESEERFRRLFNLLRDFVFVYELADEGCGKIIEVNDAVVEDLGYSREEIYGMRASQLTRDGDMSDVARAVESMGGKKEVLFEKDLLAKDGTVVPCEFSARVFLRRNRAFVVTVARDVRVRREAEEAVRRSERRLRDMLEEIEFAAVLLDRNGRVTYCNPGLAAMTGFACEEMVGQDWFERFIPEEERDDIRREFREAMRGGSVPPVYENRVLTRNGSHRVLRWNNSVIESHDGTHIGSASLGEDITDRLRAERDLRESRERLRALTAQLVDAQEKERRRVAQELHDGLSQDLFFLRMRIASVRGGADGPMARDLTEIQDLVGKALRLSRDITMDLCPPALYELGLEPALSSEAKRFEANHGIRVRFVADQEIPPLRGELVPWIYRAVRELMVNVLKHAGATKMTVEVERRGTVVCCTVEDDGTGFGSASIPASGTGFGLFSIGERLRQLGGRLDLSPGSAGGMRVSFSLDLADVPQSTGGAASAAV